MANSTLERTQYMQAHIDDSRQPKLLATLIICVVLAYVAVTLRFVARHKIRASIGADDVWILIALAIATGWVVTQFWCLRMGLGRHITVVKNLAGFMKSAIADELVYCGCNPPIKISILYFYRRIFPSRKLYHVSNGVSAIVWSSAITQAFAIGFQCIPLSSLWTGHPSRCINIAALVTAMAAVQVLTDFVILLLPMPYLWRLKVSREVRLGLLFTFALGGGVCLFGIVRAVAVGNTSHDDPSWNDVPGGIWSIIEVHVGIVCACLPTLRPLVFKSAAESKNIKAISDCDIVNGHFKFFKRLGHSDDNIAHDQPALVRNSFELLNDMQTDQADETRKKSSPFQLPSSHDAGIMITTEVGLSWEQREDGTRKKRADV